MNIEKVKIYLYIVIMLAALIFASAVFWFAKSYSLEAQSSSLKSFSVFADGKVVALPDVAKVTFGVISEGGKDLSKLQNENTSKVNQIIAFLKKEGIENKDIKTINYNISPRYQYYSCSSDEKLSKPCPPPEIVGYTLTQEVSVKIRDFTKISNILGGIVSNGANNVSSLSFEVDDLTALQNQARDIAISKAKEQAKIIAKVGGFNLGKLISLNISYDNFSRDMLYASQSVKVAKEVSLPEVEPGSKEVVASVTLQYEIR